jgi:hypothetical protein
MAYLKYLRESPLQVATFDYFLSSDLAHAAQRTGRLGDDQIMLHGFVQDGLAEIALERFAS